MAAIMVAAIGNQAPVASGKARTLKAAVEEVAEEVAEAAAAEAAAAEEARWRKRRRKRRRRRFVFFLNSFVFFSRVDSFIVMNVSFFRLAGDICFLFFKILVLLFLFQIVFLSFCFLSL